MFCHVKYVKNYEDIFGTIKTTKIRRKKLWLKEHTAAVRTLFTEFLAIYVISFWCKTYNNNTEIAYNYASYRK